MYGRGMMKREVPQKLSHSPILAVVNFNLRENSPLHIENGVFAMLGNAAAAQVRALNVQNLYLPPADR